MALAKFAPGTINSYLGSTANLVTFLLDTNNITSQEEQRARRFLDQIDSVKKMLQKKIRSRRTFVHNYTVERTAPNGRKEYF